VYGQREGNTKRATPVVGGFLIHLLCPCGVPVVVPPGQPGTEVICRSCGAGNPLPPSGLVASLRKEFSEGRRPASQEDAGATARTAHTAPAPSPAAAVAPPEFGSDERLDLGRLELAARQAGALATVSVMAGIAGALVGGVLVPGGPAVRALAAVVPLLCGILAWAAFRAIRTNALASMVLAERQRELVRYLGR
jgi:hypothetical protein